MTTPGDPNRPYGWDGPDDPAEDRGPGEPRRDAYGQTGHEGSGPQHGPRDRETGGQGEGPGGYGEGPGGYGARPGGYGEGPGGYGEGGYGGGGYGAYPPPPGGWQPPKRGGGLATAALVLGIVSLFLLVVCGIGVITAIVGLVLGILALVRGGGKGRAIAGIVLSALALLIAAAAWAWFANSNAGDCFDDRRYPTQSAKQRCLERELGVQPTTNA